MSALLSNAECGPSNALSQLQKHGDADRSLQRDRIAGSSTTRITHFPLSLAQPSTSSRSGVVNDFFPGETRLVPAFSFSRQPQTLVATHGSEWISEFPQTSAHSIGRDDGPMYANMEAALLRAQENLPRYISPPPGQKSLEWATEFSPQVVSPPGASAAFPAYARFAGVAPGTWDKEFARVEDSTSLLDAKGKGRALHETTNAALEEAFNRFSVEQQESAEAPSVQRDFTSEFESVWTQINQTPNRTDEADLASWEAQFHARRGDELGGESEWDLSDMERKYQELTAAALDMEDPNMRIQYDEDGQPDLGEYEFEKENPYRSDHSSESLASMLQQALASSDPSALTRSALILEAMLQLGDSNSSQFQLWYTLGQVLVRDERDDKGLKALVRAVKYGAHHPEGNSAVLELAIAYVNQSYDMACFLTLLRYLQSAYPTIRTLPEANDLRGQAIWSVRDTVKDAFLSLAREQHTKNRVDPEIQMGLGVLLYSEAEYDRAAECFQAALAINPENAVLWNRLGSCLSNGNRPEEAIGAYQHALQIWPNYTRAIVNIGVACLNMGAHKEAVEHFLSAIAMHDGSSSNPPLKTIPPGVKSNEDIWKTLRRTFLAMDRHDLAERALAPERSAESFRDEGFDF